MSFYGNIADTSQIQFQFDKIFPNRTEMDLAARLGQDNIFSGRFVLVKYDIDSDYFVSNLLVGYRNPTNNKIYQDHQFTIPFVYTTFQAVSEPVLNDWNKYYYYDGKYYLKLPSSEYFVSTNANYYTASWTPPANFNGILVGSDQIVRLRDNSTKDLTSSYCICTGGDIGQPANWDYYMFDDNYSDYLQNFNIDRESYGPAFDIRGYDATVWEKIYSEGHGRFILIARLNGGLFPTLELHPDPPMQPPNNPYIDVINSAESHYCIKVPSMYGFQLKKVDKIAHPEALSDERANVVSISYDEEEKKYVKETDLTDVAIYYNKKGMDIDQYFMDKTTVNEICIEPTGESGRKYVNSEGQEIKKDLLELSVYLPAIGNMVSTGYDLIYGHKPLGVDGTSDRLTDVDWINGDAEETVKTNGPTGKKSRELATLAGTLNLMHDRLGQIVVHLEGGMISPALMSENKIYELNGRYYRRAQDCDITLLEDSEYLYELDNTVTAATLAKEPNKYYIDSRTSIPRGSVPEAIAPTTFDSSKHYYKRNLNVVRYEPITLEPYISSKYYLKEGDKYIRDNSNPYPTDATQQYYDIVKVSDYTFDIPYEPRKYYTLDESTGIYTLSTTDLPLTNVDYYNIKPGTAVATNVQYYEPEVYYYIENDQYVLDKNTSITDVTREYWILTFKSEIHHGVDINGNPIEYREMESADRVYNLRTKPNANTLKTYYFQDEQGRWVPYSYLAKMDSINGRSPYTYNRTYYAINTNEHYKNDMYIPNAYYKQDDSGSYSISSEWDGNTSTHYYTLDKINLVAHPFYIPNKYWYKSGTQYPPAKEDTMIHDQYYTKKRVYVFSDNLDNCPHGYEWNDNSPYVPPSIVLYTMSEKSSYVEIKGIANGDSSINGAILNLHKEYDFENEETRDTTTFRGCLNSVKDMLYRVKELVPGEILMVNDFGQIVSTGVSWETVKTKLGL